MYFKQIDQIVDGTKTQTRRVVKANEIGDLNLAHRETYSAVHSTHDDESRLRLKWRVDKDKDYAVSPGRGKPGVWWNGSEWRLPGEIIHCADHECLIINGEEDWSYKPLRIRLLEIRRAPLQDITEAGAIAEGWPADEDVRECPHCDALYPTGWYDGPDLPCTCNPVTWYRELWGSINGAGSWDKTGDVWCLTFEVKL